MPAASEASPRKKALRQQMIARRDAIPAAERARLAELFTGKLAAMPQYREARSVLATMAIGSEWSTLAFIARALADGKRVVLPRVSEPPRHLDLHAVADLAHDLKPGVWDIPEPDPARCPRVEFSEVDFALVPALAIDRAGFRLGYGAGYFDRLLAGRGRRPFCVTALPEAFVVDAFPREAHDIPVDLVISERP